MLQARRTVLRCAISLVLLILLISQVEVSEAIRGLAQARIELLGFLFLAVIADRLLSDYRWFLLLGGATGVPPAVGYLAWLGLGLLLAAMIDQVYRGIIE
jgi:hypothetical protein